jgi:hypothetical protein
MTQLPSANDLIVRLTPTDWPSIYAARNAESVVTLSWGRTYPNPDAVVDLVGSAVEWRNFVEKIVQGYDWYLEAYVDDLSGRHTFARIAAMLPDEMAARSREAISLVDEVFREHTRVSKKRVWDLEDVFEDTDLYQRIPKILCEPLRADLQREGHLD